MEYTVYTLGGNAEIAETGSVAVTLPHEAEARLVTTDPAEAAAEVGRLVLAGYHWAGNEWLAPPEFTCNKCGQAAEPDGKGGYRHAEPVDAAACEAMFGGGMLRSLFSEEN